MKTHKVATFFHARPGDEDRPMLRDISAYTLWYSTSWGGCVVYDINAESGAEAKKIARKRRLEHEKDLEAMRSAGEPR